MAPSAPSPAAGTPPAALAPRPARPRCLLLPRQGQRGRGREAVAREAAIRAWLAAAPEGAPVSVGRLLAALRLRACADQRRAVRAALRRLGWRPAGRGRAEWLRLDGGAP